MSLKQKTVLGVPITISDKEHILEEIVKRLKSGMRNGQDVITIFTPNPEILTCTLHDKSFREVVASAQINIPDGWGISWALRRLYEIHIPRLSGVDFMRDLCRRSEELGFRVGIFGGKESVALKAKECLKAEFPRLEIEVMETPMIRLGSKQHDVGSKRQVVSSKQEVDIDSSVSSVVQQIQQKNIRILFVALGFPKQEYLIQKVQFQISNVKFQKPIVLMAVGGSLDYISGTVPRAPVWLRERGGEWLFRLLREPWRIGRQIRGLEFFWRAFRSPK